MPVYSRSTNSVIVGIISAYLYEPLRDKPAEVFANNPCSELFLHLWRTKSAEQLADDAKYIPINEFNFGSY